MTDDDITKDVDLADALRRAGDHISAEQKADLEPEGVRYCQIRYSPDDQPFIDIIEWLWKERERHQVVKYDYGDDDLKHAREGLDDGSWFWDRGVLNYAGRVRLFGVEEPLGYQALLKLAATMVAQAEHLHRDGQPLPRPGLSSGNLE